MPFSHTYSHMYMVVFLFSYNKIPHSPPIYICSSILAISLYKISHDIQDPITVSKSGSQYYT